MTRPVEFIEIDGDVFSWYCAVCGRELGADLDAVTRDGMPASGCPEHGHADLGWETWNCETDPAYPHRIIAPPTERATCTCPSGDGSLRWPCPAHPPTESTEPCLERYPDPADDVQCWLLAGHNGEHMVDGGTYRWTTPSPKVPCSVRNWTVSEPTDTSQ